MESKPWQEGIIEKKKSGKDVLNTKDMAAISKMDEGFLKKAQKAGYLNPPHYTAKYAVDGVHLQSEDEKRVEDNFDALKQKRRSTGYTSDKNLREVATSKVIQDARLEGRPVHFKYKEKSAEEVFTKFWNSPGGKERLMKARREIQNICDGGTWWETSRGEVHAMPEGYEDIFWDETKKEGARLHVLAMAGDKDAEQKYRNLQAKFPDRLPEFSTKPSEKAREAEK